MGSSQNPVAGLAEPSCWARRTQLLGSQNPVARFAKPNWWVRETQLLGFTNPALGFMNPGLGFLMEPPCWVPHGTPLLGSQNPVAGFTKPSCWFRETRKEPWILLLLLDGSSFDFLGDDFELVEEYFDNSLLNLDVYNALEKCLQCPPGFIVNPGRTHPGRTGLAHRERALLRAPFAHREPALHLCSRIPCLLHPDRLHSAPRSPHLYAQIPSPLCPTAGNHAPAHCAPAPISRLYTPTCYSPILASPAKKTVYTRQN
ncbi:hypothetical protein SLEP1_g31808 [Rubroshorea leprosula]|uniref:Uncharacterized protein n=1 Tax=Rubroshorea leprosula TaxID=152421 RepID=A0AAV5KBC5_9ROSI|nr:hypothetical protein SLEP1_g31808 [Rubroshorea leprosula]